MQLKPNIRALNFRFSDYCLITILLVACVLLVIGLTIPAFTNDRLAQGARSFSILSGAYNIGQQGSIFFMLIIFMFSAVFPTAKFLAMLSLWAIRFDERWEQHGMHWLEILGKWSMLDVFVVATTIGAAHLKLLNKTTTESGIYIFGLAILLSMLASIFLRHQLNASFSHSMRAISVGERLFGICVGLSSLLVFFLGICLPLFSVEKWVFWNKEYSLITAIPQMLAEQEYLLPATILIFVIVLPLLRFLTISTTRLIPTPPQSLVKFAYGLEKWTMWEVYALALIIVSIKLGDFTQLELQIGFWLIMCMVPLSILDGWLFKRRVELKPHDNPS